MGAASEAEEYMIVGTGIFNETWNIITINNITITMGSCFDEIDMLYMT